LGKENKHIVILTPGFPENEADTTCIPALQLYIDAFREISGYRISIISFHYPKKESTYYWNGIIVYAMGGTPFFSKIFLWRKVSTILKQIHSKEPITILHSFWLGECALIGHNFSKKNKVKHLTTLMGQDALKGNRYAKILPLKKLKLITLSKFHYQTFLDNYKIKTGIIPWGINPEDCRHSLEKRIDIIGVGSLIPLKNYELFIEIVSEINKEKPITAVIIGEGILKETLRQKIQHLNLEDAITLKGKLSYDETMAHIAQSKILFHPSSYESFGLIFAEALQCQTMIVSKAIGCFHASENWSIAETKTEMITAIENTLSKSFATEEKNPFLIDQTVQHYLSLYDN
jgi:glycosyltransferase involved in cell wall biosynthesis